MLITYLSSSSRRDKNVSERLLLQTAVEVTAVTEAMEVTTTVVMEAAPEAEAVGDEEGKEPDLEVLLDRTLPSHLGWRPPLLTGASLRGKDMAGP